MEFGKLFGMRSNTLPEMACKRRAQMSVDIDKAGGALHDYMCI